MCCRCTSEVSSSLHRCSVHVPAGVAALLNSYPALVAPAVHALCQRDAAQLPVSFATNIDNSMGNWNNWDYLECSQITRAMRYFPPETRVWTSVTFTKCLYAMAMQHNFQPDRRTGWTLPPVDDPKRSSSELGLKLVNTHFACWKLKERKETVNDIVLLRRPWDSNYWLIQNQCLKRMSSRRLLTLTLAGIDF